jgi:UDP-glucose 4-epimerase
LDLSLLRQTFRGADYVLHLAALPSVPRSINDPLRSHDVNVNGTFNVLLSARDENIKKVVFASSSSIYGDRKTIGQKKLKHKKEMMKPMPLSPYAVNKLIGENYCKVFSHIYGLPTACLRFFNVFGPRQNPKSEYAAAIPKFITSIMNDERPPVFGDGRQSRDFTYVDNVVHANILAMTSPTVKKGETMNVACGESVSLLQLIEVINLVLGKDIRPEFLPARKGDVRDSLASIEKTRRLIAYKPLVNFRQGMLQTVKWYEENHGKPAADKKIVRKPAKKSVAAVGRKA